MARTSKADTDREQKVNAALGDIPWWDKPRLVNAISTLKVEQRILKREVGMSQISYAATEDSSIRQYLQQLQWRLEAVEKQLPILEERRDQPLPDRMLTTKEDARVYHIIKNAIREFGLVDSPTSACIGYSNVPDSAIGRRLLEVFHELTEILGSILPETAKDESPLEPDKTGISSWSVKNEWARTVVRDCQKCGSICEVYDYNWNLTAGELRQRHAQKMAEFRKAEEERKNK